MQVGGGGVSRVSGVHHQDCAAGPGEHQGCGEAGGATSDDQYVVLIHVSRLAIWAGFSYQRCCFREFRVR